MMNHNIFIINMQALIIKKKIKNICDNFTPHAAQRKRNQWLLEQYQSCKQQKQCVFPELLRANPEGHTKR